MKIYWVNNIISAMIAVGTMTWLGFTTAPLPTFLLCVMAGIVFDVIFYN